MKIKTGALKTRLHGSRCCITDGVRQKTYRHAFEKEERRVRYDIRPSLESSRGLLRRRERVFIARAFNVREKTQHNVLADAGVL